MALTAKAVDAAKPNGKARKLYDGRGLFLLVQENGARGWRFRYKWEGREKLISLGTYPEITLRDARDRRDEVRRKVAHGIDASAERQATKEARKAKRCKPHSCRRSETGALRLKEVPLKGRAGRSRR